MRVRTGSRSLRASSGSRSASSSIEPRMSANSTVTCLRSPSTAARDVRIRSARCRGVVAALFFPRARGDARARVAAATDVDVVVAVGGDGTLREVLEALPDGGPAVAVVPAGTGNVLARDLGLPAAPAPAAAGVPRRAPPGPPPPAAGGGGLPLGGPPVGLAPARVDGRLCFLAASVGFDAMAVHELERRRRGPITPGTWAVALLRT